MALYAIGDLHLSLGPADKPMDVFGGRWEGYVDKLRENLRVIGPEDTTVLLGDLSWAMSLEDAAEDFAFMNAIPGRKIILKGNHDYWWTTASKMKKSIAEILLNEGYIKNFQVIDDGTQGVIRITLKYLPGKEKAIQGLRRVSKPGLRVYAGADELPRVLKGLGIAIISTSKGVMTDKAARANHVGGEVLAFVW